MHKLVIHGGAGVPDRGAMTTEREALTRVALAAALAAGDAVLRGGGSSLDAVETAVAALEDCPLFNAGRGSAFTDEGFVEMEASIMDGRSRRSGAASLLHRVRNPVRLARRVMDCSPHAMLAGEAAERFAEGQKLPLERPDYFHTAERWDAMVRLRERGGAPRFEDQLADSGRGMGTVGAVALDRHGDLAAATSTGGLAAKWAGRVGDTPVVGAGVYADNETCAVSCTGQGEYFLRGTVAYDVAARMAYLDLAIEVAAAAALQERMADAGGLGGLIALDRRGNCALPFNTPGMYRGWVGEDGERRVFIYE